jgi:hypothetical protein
MGVVKWTFRRARARKSPTYPSDHWVDVVEPSYELGLLFLRLASHNTLSCHHDIAYYLGTFHTKYITFRNVENIKNCFFSNNKKL